MSDNDNKNSIKDYNIGESYVQNYYSVQDSGANNINEYSSINQGTNDVRYSNRINNNHEFEQLGNNNLIGKINNLDINRFNNNAFSKADQISTEKSMIDNHNYGYTSKKHDPLENQPLHYEFIIPDDKNYKVDDININLQVDNADYALKYGKQESTNIPGPSQQFDNVFNGMSITNNVKAMSEKLKNIGTQTGFGYSKPRQFNFGTVSEEKYEMNQNNRQQNAKQTTNEYEPNLQTPDLDTATLNNEDRLSLVATVLNDGYKVEYKQMDPNVNQNTIFGFPKSHETIGKYVNKNNDDPKKDIEDFMNINTESYIKYTNDKYKHPISDSYPVSNGNTYLSQPDRTIQPSYNPTNATMSSTICAGDLLIDQNDLDRNNYRTKVNVDDNTDFTTLSNSRSDMEFAHESDKSDIPSKLFNDKSMIPCYNANEILEIDTLDGQITSNILKPVKVNGDNRLYDHGQNTNLSKLKQPLYFEAKLPSVPNIDAKNMMNIASKLKEIPYFKKSVPNQTPHNTLPDLSVKSNKRGLVAWSNTSKNNPLFTYENNPMTSSSWNNPPKEIISQPQVGPFNSGYALAKCAPSSGPYHYLNNNNMFSTKHLQIGDKSQWGWGKLSPRDRTNNISPYNQYKNNQILSPTPNENLNNNKLFPSCKIPQINSYPKRDSAKNSIISPEDSTNNKPLFSWYQNQESKNFEYYNNPNNNLYPTNSLQSNTYPQWDLRKPSTISPWDRTNNMSPKTENTQTVTSPQSALRKQLTMVPWDCASNKSPYHWSEITNNKNFGIFNDLNDNMYSTISPPSMTSTKEPWHGNNKSPFGWSQNPHNKNSGTYNNPNENLFSTIKPKTINNSLWNSGKSSPISPWDGSYNRSPSYENPHNNNIDTHNNPEKYNMYSTIRPQTNTVKQREVDKPSTVAPWNGKINKPPFKWYAKPETIKLFPPNSGRCNNPNKNSFATKRPQIEGLQWNFEKSNSKSPNWNADNKNLDPYRSNNNIDPMKSHQTNSGPQWDASIESILPKWDKINKSPYIWNANNENEVASYPTRSPYTHPYMYQADIQPVDLGKPSLVPPKDIKTMDKKYNKFICNRNGNPQNKMCGIPYSPSYKNKYLTKSPQTNTNPVLIMGTIPPWDKIYNNFPYNWNANPQNENYEPNRQPYIGPYHSCNYLNPFKSIDSNSSPQWEVGKSSTAPQQDGINKKSPYKWYANPQNTNPFNPTLAPYNHPYSGSTESPKLNTDPQRGFGMPSTVAPWDGTYNKLFPYNWCASPQIYNSPQWNSGQPSTLSPMQQTYSPKEPVQYVGKQIPSEQNPYSNYPFPNQDVPYSNHLSSKPRLESHEPNNMDHNIFPSIQLQNPYKNGKPYQNIANQASQNPLLSYKIPFQNYLNRINYNPSLDSNRPINNLNQPSQPYSYQLLPVPSNSYHNNLNNPTSIEIQNTYRNTKSCHNIGILPLHNSPLNNPLSSQLKANLINSNPGLLSYQQSNNIIPSEPHAIYSLTPPRSVDNNNLNLPANSIKFENSYEKTKPAFDNYSIHPSIYTQTNKIHVPQKNLNPLSDLINIASDSLPYPHPQKTFKTPCANHSNKKTFSPFDSWKVFYPDSCTCENIQTPDAKNTIPFQNANMNVKILNTDYICSIYSTANKKPLERIFSAINVFPDKNKYHTPEILYETPNFESNHRNQNIGLISTYPLYKEIDSNANKNYNNLKVITMPNAYNFSPLDNFGQSLSNLNLYRNKYGNTDLPHDPFSAYPNQLAPETSTQKYIHQKQFCPQNVSPNSQMDLAGNLIMYTNKQIPANTITANPFIQRNEIPKCISCNTPSFENYNQRINNIGNIFANIAQKDISTPQVRPLEYLKHFPDLHSGTLTCPNSSNKTTIFPKQNLHLASLNSFTPSLEGQDYKKTIASLQPVFSKPYSSSVFELKPTYKPSEWAAETIPFASLGGKPWANFSTQIGPHKMPIGGNFVVSNPYQIDLETLTATINDPFITNPNIQNECSLVTNNKVNENIKILKNKIGAILPEVIENIKENNYNLINNIKTTIGNIAIASYLPNREFVVKTGNPDIDIAAWYSKIKIINAALIFDINEMSVLNFMPVLKKSVNISPDEAEVIAKDFITKNYGEPLVVKGVYSSYKPNAIVVSPDDVTKHYILWPTLCNCGCNCSGCRCQYLN
ncbi:unnamed protein product [Leptidea sinapis]|uniref:Uncharacterized protein n=1 Tax=Leptidea sinapis TaxID=189913 RepID=A0A5E4QER4_9NEOP|nr:unnamed protein product [Leptidea sinapis]